MAKIKVKTPVVDLDGDDDTQAAGHRHWRGHSSSTLPERKYMISLETDFKAQTTNWVFPGQTGSVVLTPMQQIATSGLG